MNTFADLIAALEANVAKYEAIIADPKTGSDEEFALARVVDGFKRQIAALRRRAAAS